MIVGRILSAIGLTDQDTATADHSALVVAGGGLDRLRLLVCSSLASTPRPGHFGRQEEGRSAADLTRTN